MASVNETTVSLKIEVSTAQIKNLIKQINSIFKSALKTDFDLNFNVKGEKRIEALKKRLSKAVDVPVNFKQPKDIPKPNNTPSPIKLPEIPMPKFSFDNLKNQFGELSNQIQGIFASSAILGMNKGVVQGVVSVGSEFENLKTVLSNALGGEEQGNAMLEIVRDTAREINGNLGEVGSAYNKLINRGLQPTKEEMIAFNDLAKSQGKDLDQWIEAILDGMTGENERLKEFGVKAKDAEDSWIYTFKGVSTAVKKNEKDIYNYMKSIGMMDGVMGMSAKSAETFSGKMNTLKSQFDSIKISIFEKLNEALAPIIDGIIKVVESVSKWVSENSQLATTILVVVTSVTSLIAMLMGLAPLIPLIAGLFTVLSGPIGTVIAVIAGLIFIIWDLWNGLTSGQSYILATIDSFLEWLGIGLTVQEMIDGIKVVLEILWVYVVDVVVPVIVAQFQFLVDFVVALFEFWKEWISGWIDIIVGLFTGNIPLAKQGFEKLENLVLNIFDRIVAAANNAVSKILGAFAGGLNKVGDMLSKIPGLDGLGKMAKDGANGLKDMSVKAKVEGQKATNRVESRNGQTKVSKGTDKKNKRMKFPDWKKEEKGKVDPYSKMTKVTSSPDDSKKKKKNKKGKNKKGKKDKGEKKGKDTIGDNKIIVSAIESLQDILKKTGYSITDEIKRADLFQAKRQALLESQKQTGALELFKNLKERFTGVNQTTVKNEINITFDNKGNVVANGKRINSDTKLSDLFKIQNARMGGG